MQNLGGQTKSIMVFSGVAYCDFTDTFAVLTEAADFAEFTDLYSQRTLGNQINIYKYNK